MTLVWAWEAFRDQDAFEMEQRIKGWSRAKKQALIRGDFPELSRLAKSYAERGLRPSTGSGR